MAGPPLLIAGSLAGAPYPVRIDGELILTEAIIAVMPMHRRLFRDDSVAGLQNRDKWRLPAACTIAGNGAGSYNESYCLSKKMASPAAAGAGKQLKTGNR